MKVMMIRTGCVLVTYQYIGFHSSNQVCAFIFLVFSAVLLPLFD